MLRFNSFLCPFSALFRDFNTSYVTVQHRTLDQYGNNCQISIHPMLRFNYFLQFYKHKFNIISIHPMLRFNVSGKKYIKGARYFNTSYVTVQLSFCIYILYFFQISIHPMLRFNLILSFFSLLKDLFQYILCYGSTVLFSPNPQNQNQFQYILCYGSTPTLSGLFTSKRYFNTSYVTVQLKSLFQIKS